jgi:hypothetical protein
MKLVIYARNVVMVAKCEESNEITLTSVDQMEAREKMKTS